MNKKCAIFNYWWAYADAHGASLTALALYKLIEELGYDPCLIMTVFKDIDIEKCRLGRHFKFIEKYAKHSIKNYQTAEEYQELNNEYDHYIVGSDQVLRIEWVPDEWFLYSIKSNKNKIIMSGSFGGDTLNASTERIKRVAKYLNDFSAVSVREKDGIEVYQHYFGQRGDIEWIMDPVFLIDTKYYYKLMDTSSGNKYIWKSEKEVVFFYFLDDIPEIKKIKEKITKLYNVIIIEDNENMMAEDFLYTVSNCKMMITDSFHGMCFAIIFNIPFYCFYNKMRGTSRIDTIKNVFKLDEVILEVDTVDTNEFIIPEIDYKRINQTIYSERKKGRKWLKLMLDAYKKVF